MKDDKKIEEKKKGIVGILCDNKKVIIAFIGGAAITGIICGILWPSRLAKLSDGSDIVAKINGIEISANTLYDELSTRGGLSALLEMIDEEILLDKYDLKSEAKAYAKEQSTGYYEQWESVYGYSKDEFLKNNGFTNEEEFMHYLEIEFYKNKYIEDYLNNQITDEEVQKYYDDVVKGERRAYVFYTTEDGKNLSKVKKALEKGSDIEKLAEKYSDLSYRDLGNINFNNYNIYTEKFLTELHKVKKGKVSKVFADDNFGNVIIYVTDIKEKEAYDAVKDQIRKNLGQELNNKDQNLFYRAFQELRAEYELEISDSKMKKLYDDFVEQTKEK